MSQAPIQFKVFIHTIDNSVIVNHEVGIIEVPLKDLLAYPTLHPDLVEAAMTSIKELARKYNGVEDEANNQAANQASQQQAATAAQGQSGNANEEAGQVIQPGQVA